MAARRPLVVINGVQQELPIGDSAIGAVAILNSGTTTVDFSTGSNDASVSILSQDNILDTSSVWAVIEPADVGTHTINDHKYASSMIGLTCAITGAGIGFTIYATSIHKLSGVFNVRWTWI